MLLKFCCKPILRVAKLVRFLQLYFAFFIQQGLAQPTPQLHGSLPSVASSNAYFRYFENGKFQEDTTRIIQGKFHFKYNNSDDKLGILTIDNLRGSLLVYVSGYSNIKVNEQQFWKSKVVASKKSLEFVRINAVVEDIQDTLMHLNKLYFSQNRSEPLRLSDSLRINELIKQLNQYKMQFIAENPNSEFSLFYLKDVLKLYSRVELERVLGRFSKAVKKHNMYEFLFGKLRNMQQLAIATKVTPSRFTKLNGEIFDIDSVKTPFVLINVWGTWCGPCVYELPQLRALHKSYGNTSVTVLSIANEIKSISKVDFMRFIESNNLNWQHVLLYASESNHKLIVNSLGIASYPTNILIDSRSRKVVLVANTKLLLDDVATYLRDFENGVIRVK